MQKVFIDSLDLNNTFFHFDIRDVGFIEKYGFLADIGPDSENAERTPKVFFSKGIKGVLDIIDVWLIWRMNKDHYKTKNWIEEFLSEAYLNDDVKKEETFNNMHQWLKKRKYYKLDLVEGIDYLKNDIDEAKENVLQDKYEKSKTNEMSLKYLFACQMYKNKVKHNDLTMEEWNMHTISGHDISSNKIYLIETKDGRNDALSIIKSLYEQYDNKDEFRLLNSFIYYCKNKDDFFSKISTKK